MLGRTAGAMMWMARYLERIDSSVRLLDAGLRLEITGADEQNVWSSILATAGLDEVHDEYFDTAERDHVVDFMVRDIRNPSNVLGLIELVRSNSQAGRVMLPQEVVESINDGRREFARLLTKPVTDRDLPAVLRQVLRVTSQIQGVLQSTMYRGDPFRFVRLGTFIERADNTARLLDVKYYVLLPDANRVGSFLDAMQWELVLRSVAAHKSYRRNQSRTVDAPGIVQFLVLNRYQPRSMRYCTSELAEHLRFLTSRHGDRPSLHRAEEVDARLAAASVSSIIDEGLHDFLESYTETIHQLSDQIERDFRFNP